MTSTTNIRLKFGLRGADSRRPMVPENLAAAAAVRLERRFQGCREIRGLNPVQTDLRQLCMAPIFVTSDLRFVHVTPAPILARLE